MKHLILDVDPDSICDEMGVESGDFLLEINGIPMIDIFEYRINIAVEELEILIEKTDGEQWILQIEKDADEDLGLNFDGIMSPPRVCENSCIFCFVDQLPPNMRQSLYFKDDDYRLGFLYGNYISLTNISIFDIKRIISMRMSPVNISIHTTNPDLRVQMLGNQRAGAVLEYIGILAKGGISMNFQIVLCKGINDGAELDRTIADLARFIPSAVSLSVVPVGITKHRENLTNLELFDKIEATNIIVQIHNWRSRLWARYGRKFVHLADEFYILADCAVPDFGEYEDFPQLENGVGMLRLFIDDFADSINNMMPITHLDLRVSIVTGLAMNRVMTAIASILQNRFPGLIVEIIPIVNDTLGMRVTVAGLICGRDIINQLAGRDLGDLLLVPQSALKYDTDIFLDNISLYEISEKLNVQVEAVPNEGAALLKTILANAGRG